MWNSASAIPPINSGNIHRIRFLGAANEAWDLIYLCSILVSHTLFNAQTADQHKYIYIHASSCANTLLLIFFGDYKTACRGEGDAPDG